MEIFGGWIRELVMLLMFVVFLELLLPRNSLAPLIRVVAGLLILVTILKPVVVWLHDFHPMEMTLEGRSAEMPSTERNPMGFLKAAYEQGMADKIKAYLSEQGYDSMRVKVSMGIDKEQIKMKSVDIIGKAADVQAMRAEVCRTFGLSQSAVTITQEGD